MKCTLYLPGYSRLVQYLSVQARAEVGRGEPGCLMQLTRIRSTRGMADTSEEVGMAVRADQVEEQTEKGHDNRGLGGG